MPLVLKEVIEPLIKKKNVDPNDLGNNYRLVSNISFWGEGDREQEEAFKTAPAVSG